MTMISPSLLAIQALGLSPEGSAVCNAEDLACAVCGSSIRRGDPVDDLVLPPSFTNRNSLVRPLGSYRCGACTAVMSRPEFQMGLSSALFSVEGYYPIARKEHRAWALLTPPEPPFAICVQTSQQQHVVWRAPVSLSRALIMMRVGERIIRLRSRSLAEAREVALMLHERRRRHEASASRSRGRPANADTIESPFVSDWKMQSVAGGTFKRWMATMLEEGIVAATDLEPLYRLNGGEVWALSAVLHPHPVKPAPLHLN